MIDSNRLMRYSILLSFFLISAADYADARHLRAAERELLSAEQAQSLAERFAHRFLGEASITSPHLEGDLWEFTVRFGYEGTASAEPLVVNRVTSKVSYKGTTDDELDASGYFKHGD